MATETARPLPPMPPVTVPPAEHLTVLAETFRLLGDPTRLRILYFCLAGPCAVGTIAACLGLSQALVSHHLRLLRSARLMRAERQARHVFYELADDHVRGILVSLAEHVDEVPPAATEKAGPAPAL